MLYQIWVEDRKLVDDTKSIFCPLTIWSASRFAHLRVDVSCASMRGAEVIREARTRAGLTQDELEKISGRPRSLIARWEQGSVSPSIDNFLEIIEVCGFELPLVLVERDTSLDGRLDTNRRLSPERRARRLTGKLGKSGTPDA